MAYTIFSVGIVSIVFIVVYDDSLTTCMWPGTKNSDFLMNTFQLNIDFYVQGIIRAITNKCTAFI